MELFIDALEESAIADKLSRAVVGRGAFLRSKDELSRSPELLDQWLGYTEDRHRGRARAWLAGEGYPVAAATTRHGA